MAEVNATQSEVTEIVLPMSTYTAIHTFLSKLDVQSLFSDDSQVVASVDEVKQLFDLLQNTAKVK